MYLPWSQQFKRHLKKSANSLQLLAPPLYVSAAESSKGPTIWAFSMLLIHLPGCHNLLTAISQYNFFLCQSLPHLFFLSFIVVSP